MLNVTKCITDKWLFQEIFLVQTHGLIYFSQSFGSNYYLCIFNIFPHIMHYLLIL